MRAYWCKHNMPKKDPNKPNCSSCGGRQILPYRNSSYERDYKLCTTCKGTGNSPTKEQ